MTRLQTAWAALGALAFAATAAAQLPKSKYNRIPHRADDPRISGHVWEAGAHRPAGPDMEVRIVGPALARLEDSEIQYAVGADGSYVFTVPPGSYDLVTQAGKYRAESEHVELRAGDRQVRDFTVPLAEASAAYTVTSVPLPRQMVPEVSGIAFTPGGSLVVCTRRGEVWIRDAATGKWRRFADGLFEPFGVVAVSDREVYVTERGQLTELVDLGGRGEADQYAVINNATGMTGNYHEFAYGLVRDRYGNFYGANGMSSKDGDNFAGIVSKGPLKLPKNVPGDSTDDHRSLVPYEGWTWEITPQGTFIPLATGFRQALGIGLSPDGDLFATDVSGSWIPTSKISRVEAGHFYGHPDGLKWDPRFADHPPTVAELRQMLTPPAVYVPRGPLGSGLGNPVWDTTGGRFGPYAGQMFVPDWTGVIVRVALERVAGEYQGAVFRFLSGQGLNIGAVRAAFGPDGDLYVGQTLRGWASTANEGLQRIHWNGSAPTEMLTMRLTPAGFALRFTRPMRADELAAAARYRFKRFRYNYSIDDGSLRMDETDVPVAAARPHADGRGVDLDLVELLPDFVYELDIEGLHGAGGEPLENPYAYYTANRLLAAQPFAGHSTLAPRSTALLPPDPAAGRAIFAASCVVCHQPDGRGSKQVGTPDFTQPNGPLTLPDEPLVHQITFGGKVMPPFGHVLSPQDIRNVLAFLRAQFGPAAKKAPVPRS